MSQFCLDTDDLTRFQRDGFIIVPHLFDPEEVELLRNVARADHALAQGSYGRRDGQGGEVRLALSNDVGDDLYGAIVRCQRVAGTMERLLGDEVYHYHHKMILKDPLVGGAWEWHQDYGYWYHNGCLAPDMGSCMIAVDRATRPNGCLQVLKGSHRLGRIDHGKVGDQTGADLERVNAALERLELVYCEMEPGSAIFFHSNLLHRSDQNRSTEPRWAFIACYNTKHNDPYKDSRHPRYALLEKWEDASVKELGHRQRASLIGRVQH